MDKIKIINLTKFRTKDCFIDYINEKELYELKLIAKNSGVDASFCMKKECVIALIRYGTMLANHISLKEAQRMMDNLLLKNVNLVLN